MSVPSPDPARSARQAPAWLRRVGVVLPFIVTIVVAVGLTLLIQNLLIAPRSAAELRLPEPLAGQAETPTATPVPTRQPTRTPAPTPTPPLPSPIITGITGSDPRVAPDPDELALLRREMERLWSAYYLARAANQIADAEAALQINNFDHVEQSVTAAAASVNRAYEYSAEQEKGPISEFRAQLSTLREEVRVRPEGMDQRLRSLRQRMLSLADAGA